MRRFINGVSFQLVDALALLLPQSHLYPVLSSLPPPDPTNPTCTSTFTTQSAIQNSLPVLEEIVCLLEGDEDERFSQQVEKWRTRLNAPSLDAIRQKVGREIWSNSRVRPSFSNRFVGLDTTNRLFPAA
jgi:superkiller protein 3